MAEDTYIQRSSDCNQCYSFKILISSHSLAFYRLSRSRLALRLFLHTLEGYLCSKKQTRVVLDFLDYSFPSPFSLTLRITRERRFRDVLQDGWPMLSPEHTQNGRGEYPFYVEKHTHCLELEAVYYWLFIIPRDSRNALSTLDHIKMKSWELGQTDVSFRFTHGIGGGKRKKGKIQMQSAFFRRKVY